MALSSKRYENVVRYYYLPAEKCALIQSFAGPQKYQINIQMLLACLLAGFFEATWSFYWRRDTNQHLNFCEKQQTSVLLVLSVGFVVFWVFFLSQIHIFISPIRTGSLLMLVSRSEHHLRTFETVLFSWTHQDY